MEKQHNEIFMGKVVKPTNNPIKHYYNAEQYKEHIMNAHNAGLSLSNYMSIISQPCHVCGNDKVHIELIKKDIKRTSNNHCVHLFIFDNTKLNSQTERTDLKLQFMLAGMLQVSTESTIFTPRGTHKYSEGKTTATVTVFKNDIRISTTNCIIKDNKIFQNEAI